MLQGPQDNPYKKGTSGKIPILPSGQTAYPVYARVGFTKYDRVGALCQQLGIFASQAEYLLGLHYYIDTLTTMINMYYLQWGGAPSVDDIELEDRAKKLLRLIIFGRSLQLQWYAVHPSIRVAWVDGWFSITQLLRWIEGLSGYTGIDLAVLRDGEACLDCQKSVEMVQDRYQKQEPDMDMASMAGIGPKSA